MTAKKITTKKSLATQTKKSKVPKRPSPSSLSRPEVVFSLNGRLTRVGGADSLMMLADWLRKRAGHPGTKIVCAEGDCGACTVVRAFVPRSSRETPVFLAMNSCITTVAQMDGSHLVTVEGLTVDGELSPVQSCMRQAHGSQCGYCTPGFVMALTGALERTAQLDRKQAANCTTGNLCRCTGYEPILNAAEQMTPSAKHRLASRYLTKQLLKAVRDATQLPLLLDVVNATVAPISPTQRRLFFAPTTLSAASAFMKRHKDARLFAAGSDLGVQLNKGKPFPPNVMSLQAIPDLYALKRSKTLLSVGARVTLGNLRLAAKDCHPEFARFLDIFASPQIKHVATLVGNLANASPIGDTLPFLLATDAVIHVLTPSGGTHKIPITKFFLGYKKLALNSGEFIIGVDIPINDRSHSMRLYKVSQRKDLDISAVSAAIAMPLSHQGLIHNAAIAFGGVAATPMRLYAVESLLENQKPSLELWQRATAQLHEHMEPLSDVRGTSAYRRVLVDHIFRSYTHDLLYGQGVFAP
jgi:xanthine dehydrogenase small subunit